MLFSVDDYLSEKLYVVKSIFYLAAIAVLFVISCNRQDYEERELPSLTQEGRDILACIVNGAIHLYSGKSSFGDPNGVLYHRLPEELLLYADESDLGDAIRISLDTPALIMPGTIYFFATGSNDPNYAQYYSDAANPYFITKDGSGWIRFTRVDSAIAAGTFEFTAYFNNDSVRITEGRFDIAR